MAAFEECVSRRTLLGATLGGTALAALAVPAAHASLPFGLASRAATVAKFTGQQPTYWGMYAPGVRSRFSTSTAAGKDAVCLTFDACGGQTTRYDATLIATLRKYQVHATLFINRLWAQNNPTTFAQLLADPLFDVQSHGSAHVPLSVTGRSAYGIKGTEGIGGVWDEVAGCYSYMGRYFDRHPRFMRPGTCYTDDVAARAAAYMGQELVSFTINGDAGASYAASTVATEVAKAKPGDIVISHMNHPGGGTAPGYAKAIPALKARGYAFRTLSQVAGYTPVRWVTIQYGSRGAEVVLVQRFLHLTADGNFGSITRTAVRSYQSTHRLVVDGVVGPLTAHSMGLF